jgi:outer membrane protein assembly factor BamB
MVFAAIPAGAQDWPQFRGPESRGVAENPNLLDKWSATEGVRWKVDLVGRGWSSPIVAGDRIFLTSVVSEKKPENATKGLYFGGNRSNIPEDPHTWHVVCLDLKSGDVQWDKVVHEGKPLRPRHIKNSYASETPVTDGENIYALFGDVGLFCLSIDGELKWEKPFEPYKTRFDWGPAASPVLYRDRVYVVNDNDEDSFLVAFNKTTGDEVWRVKRDEKSNWATPFIWENADRAEIITPGTGRTRAYDLDGKLLYEFGGASSITIGTPYTAHGLLYVSSGYVMDKKRPIFAIRPGASGDISLADKETSSPYIAWSQPEAAPYNPTTIVYGDILYVLQDRGFFGAYDAKTGEEIYGKKRLPNGRAFTASPWAYNDRVFCLNEYGETFVIKAGREFEILHTNPLAEDDMCMATPAITGDNLLIRTDLRLYCVGR